MFLLKCRIWLIILVLVALLGGMGYSREPIRPEEINIPVLISGSIPPEWGLEIYSPRSFTVHFQRGETVILSAFPEGTGSIFVRTKLIIEVTHSNGTRAGMEITFCSPSPFCICNELPPQDITSLFEPGRNRVSVKLRSWCGPIVSYGLYLVEFTKTSALQLTRRMIRELSELRREFAGSKGSWDTSTITWKLQRALRYIPHASLRPRRGAMAQILLENAMELIRKIDFGELIEQVKEGLPELRGEIEVLIKLNELNEAVEDQGKETLNSIEGLYKLLCSLNPMASDCAEVGVGGVTPGGQTWSQVKSELNEVMKILQDAHRIIPIDPDEAMRLIKEAANLLLPPINKLNESWQQIDTRLTQLRYQLRLFQRILRRSGCQVRAQDRAFLEIWPNPLKGDLPIEVAAGGPTESIKLRIFTLGGRLILCKEVEGNYLRLDPLNTPDRPLANGVYLVMITIKDRDGSVISEVRKLAILR